MRQLTQSVLVLGLCALILGCTPTNYYTQTAQNWRGKSIDAVLRQWGTPSIRFNKPVGGSILTYKTTSYQANIPLSAPTVGVNNSAQGRPVIVAPTSPNQRQTLKITCTTIFETDARGIVTYVRTSGGC